MKSVPSWALLGLVFCASAVVAAPYQELEPMKGYVPVYIRIGDTPLSEIHPKLAEAFHENETGSSLTLEKNEATVEESQQKIADPAPKQDETTQPHPETTEPAKPAKESDIASFDVVSKREQETTKAAGGSNAE